MKYENNMIYSYAELKDKIQVGDTVRAVPEKLNPCSKLNNDGSNTAKISRVDSNGFSINGCAHPYTFDFFLDLLLQEITWDTLSVGDEVMNSSNTLRKVLAVLGDVVGVSRTLDLREFDSWHTKITLQEVGYIIVQPTLPTPQKTFLTMDEIAKKFGVDVKDLEIKKE